MESGTDCHPKACCTWQVRSPEEQMENKFTRSVGMIPDEWQGISDMM
jgi:hypothetical protein